MPIFWVRPAMARLRNYPLLIYALCCSLSLGTTVSAAESAVKDSASSYIAVTTKDTDVPLGQLELLLKPLIVDEVEIEVRAWQALLKAKVKEISDAEIAATHQKEEVKKARDAEGVSKEAGESDQKAREELAQEKEMAKEAVEHESEMRSKMLDRLAELRAQRTALIDRMKLAVMEFERKGGKKEAVELYRKYIAAVSGIKVDVSDAQAAWATVYGWLSSEEGGLRWAKNIGVFVVTVIAFVFLARLASKALAKALAASGKAPELLRNFMISGVRRLIIIIGVIVGLAALEVNIGPLLAVIGAAGFVIALALQKSLSNFASGILILFYRPFDVGNVVTAGGVSGTVKSMNLLSTQITTFDNKLMIVPNNDVWEGVITNATGTDRRRVDMVFGIGYGADVDRVQKILEEIVNAHELVLEEPEPMIRLNELAESSVNFICRPWAKTADYWTVYWDVMRAVKERFGQEGISIPFPQRDVHLYHETPPHDVAG
jgi:small conductance mechanosensitive channel